MTEYTLIGILTVLLIISTLVSELNIHLRKKAEDVLTLKLREEKVLRMRFGVTKNRAIKWVKREGDLDA